MAARTICVLGGSGFVGTQLCAALASAGWIITVPTRNPDRAQPPEPLPTLALVAADVHDGDGSRCSAPPGRGRKSGRHPERARPRRQWIRARPRDARPKVVAACRRQRVPRLLQMSALNADADIGLSHYLRSKGRAERVMREECGPDLGMDDIPAVRDLRAARRFREPVPRLLSVIPLVLPLARPGARFAPVWVEDVVAAFMRSLADDGDRRRMLRTRRAGDLHAP